MPALLAEHVVSDCWSDAMHVLAFTLVAATLSQGRLFGGYPYAALFGCLTDRRNLVKNLSRGCIAGEQLSEMVILGSC